MRNSPGDEYEAFFTDLVQRFRRFRPNDIGWAKVSKDSWYSFGGGRSGFSLRWALTSKGEFQTELYIDMRNQNRNDRALAMLRAERAQIEHEIGAQLQWLPLEGKQGCRITAIQPGTIYDPPEHLEELKVWGVDMMARFVDILKPRIRKLEI